ncbi:actin cytoskeleton-regulatory complex protein PAN1-like [Aplysia californica]|uniref:Actin cytoskeleton-regulatory complex protein PAN1-like n=1 Tax=Aplysia californica TaxID=6500 RepID=A0ABM1VXD1_APLCA|nr:actin cytoskeleton-regulatory complex protein PAN1-like [Aplysia californica]
MPSNSTQLRHKWKAEEPEKYEAHLEKERLRSKARRDAKKAKWDTEPHTRAMIAEKEKEREQRRIRMKRMAQRRRAEERRELRRDCNSSVDEDRPKKKPKDMTEEERRAHVNELRRQSRARQNPQKKRWAKVKNAEYQRQYRERQKDSTQMQPATTAPVAQPQPAPVFASPPPSTTAPEFASPQPRPAPVFAASPPPSTTAPEFASPQPRPALVFAASPPPSTTAPEFASPQPRPALVFAASPPPSTTAPEFASPQPRPAPVFAASPPPSTTAPVFASPQPLPPAVCSSPHLRPVTTPVFASSFLNALDLSTSVPRQSPLPVTSAAPPSTTPIRASKTMRNLSSHIKSDIKKRVRTPEEYAHVVRHLATPRTPEKRRALLAVGVQQQVDRPLRPVPPQKVQPSRRKRTPSLVQTRAFRDVQAFYLRQDVARVLPHKRYATKAGPGRIMLMTLKEAFILFKKENPDAAVGFTKFTTLRPKTVRLIGQGTAETCACMYCLNVRLKIEVLNRVMARNLEDFRMPPETRLLDLLLCPKEAGSDWHHPACLEGKCSQCQDPSNFLQGQFGRYEATITPWQHWERISKEGRMRLELLTKQGTLE